MDQEYSFYNGNEGEKVKEFHRRQKVLWAVCRKEIRKQDLLVG